MLTFMTFNIRHDHHEDSPTSPFAEAPVKEDPFDPSQFALEQPWALRKWKVVDTILLYSPDILALQEPVHHQLLDVQALLQDEYEWIGRGRNDGDLKGEFSAIFYKRQVVSVVDWETFWLSETPEVPGSKGWDARHPRVATQAKFKRVNDNVEFTVFNAHLDHKGTLAREESAKLMLERARQASGDGAVFLLGDLNSTEVDPAYTILTGDQYTSGSNDTLANLEQLNQVCVSNYVNRTGQPIHTTNGSVTLPTHRVIRPGQLLQQLQNGHDNNKEEKNSHFLDLSHHLETRITTKGDCHSLSGPYGFRDTFTSFGLGDESKRAPIRIDFIMALDSTNVKVRHYAVLSNQFDDGLLFSDHRPVLARLNW